MSQFNLFTGEIEDSIAVIEPDELEVIPEPPPIPKRTKKRRKDFEIGKCKRCGQLLLNDPENTRIKIDEELCEDCDSRLRAMYDKYKNYALIKALRAHRR